MEILSNPLKMLLPLWKEINKKYKIPSLNANYNP